MDDDFVHIHATMGGEAVSDDGACTYPVPHQAPT